MWDSTKMEFVFYSIIVLILLLQLMVGVKIYSLLKFTLIKKLLPLQGKNRISGKPLQKCKTCRHRLSYINIEHNAKDDFYYRCKLHHIEIHLEDGCKNFKPDLESKDSK